jgi:hypothetical protein
MKGKKNTRHHAMMMDVRAFRITELNDAVVFGTHT